MIGSVLACGLVFIKKGEARMGVNFRLDLVRSFFFILLFPVTLCTVVKLSLVVLVADSVLLNAHLIWLCSSKEVTLRGSLVLFDAKVVHRLQSLK